ncbi:MAG TPA: oligosaccharide flippase family protein [Longimicrobiaceae bacterium]|nr:oligosaccharide flippase family protein [Longimicrobiaceae bacterium]
MTGKTKSLGKQSAIYGAGIIVGKLASFIMLPVYTRYLTPADYGVLELLSMTIDVIGMIAGMGIGAAVFKFYSDADDATAKNRVISTAGISTAVLGAVTAALGLLLAPLLTRLVIGEGADPLYLRIFFLTYLFQSCEHVPMMLLRARQQAGRVVTRNVARLVLNLSLSILFVVYFQMGVLGVLLSGLITGAVMAVVLSVYLVREVGLRFSADRFGAMVRFGSPMVLWTLGSFVLVFSDRFFLNHYVGTAEVGIYSLAYKFAFMLSALAFSPFDLVWDPHRYEVAKRSDAKEVYARVFLYMNVAVGLGALGISLFVKDFLGVMSDPAFLPAYRFVPLLLLAQTFSHWVSYVTLGLFVSSNTRALGHIAFLAVVSTLVLNFLLVPRFGIVGATSATVVAYALRFFWTYRSAQRHYPIQYGWGAIARLYGIFGAAVALRWAVQPDHLPGSLAWSTLLMLAATALVYRHILGPAERSWVRSFFARSRVGLALGASRA